MRLAGIQEVESNAYRAESVTTHNSNTFAPTKGIYLGSSGDVSLIMSDGKTQLFKNMASGVIHPITCIGVRTTGTTANDIVRVY